VESAAYFAVAELQANAAKHARATEVTVELGYGTRMLTATVTDDGGGAAASEGSGPPAFCGASDRASKQRAEPGGDDHPSRRSRPCRK
jgi:glucose-6-phosphate-specific signal transduction histidine kinase